MVMRFLFGLAGSLLSGSVVAVFFTAFVQYVFPDSTGYQPAPIGNLAAHEDRRAKRDPRPEPAPQSSTRPPIQPAAVTEAGSDAAKALKQASDHTSQRALTTIPPTAGQSLGPQSDQESRALAQEAARNKEQLLSASMAADVLTDNVHQEAEAPKTTPPLPAHENTVAGVLQPISAASSQEPNTAPRPLTDQNLQNHKRDIAKFSVAGDSHAGAVASSRAPRGRPTTHASHRAHRRLGHTEDPRAPIRQAQRQAQE